jgi:hypothetical protein
LYYISIGFLFLKNTLYYLVVRGISVQELDFLSIDGNGAQISLGHPDPNEWDLVDVFLKFSSAVSRANTEREYNPGVPLIIQPYKGGEAALFRKRE